MDKQAFFLTVEPNEAEIAAAQPAPGVRARRSANNPRATLLFTTRANRLWLEATNPAQAARDDFAKVLISKGGKEWTSDAGHDRVYFDFVPLTDRTAMSGYFDVSTGIWHSKSGSLIDQEILTAFFAKVGL